MAGSDEVNNAIKGGLYDKTLFYYWLIVILQLESEHLIVPSYMTFFELSTPITCYVYTKKFCDNLEPVDV